MRNDKPELENLHRSFRSDAWREKCEAKILHGVGGTGACWVLACVQMYRYKVAGSLRALIKASGAAITVKDCLQWF